MERLPLTAKMGEYQEQAAALLQGHARRDPEALQILHQNHPRFLNTEVRWLPLLLSPEDIGAAPLRAHDARLALARWYSFRDWDALAGFVNAIEQRKPGVYEFEFASEAVITGDLPALKTMLQNAPRLVLARSSRVTCHDPATHRATLLHYIAANGVEGYRQKTPNNAVDVAKLLLDSGADPDALAGMYGGESATLSMLVSSTPPAEAGLQVPLLEVLIDYGADPNGTGSGNWTNPILTALIFGFRDAAGALARRGARTDRLAVAAGLGRLKDAEALLPGADPSERHRALALAAQLGQGDVVRLLLDAGEDPNRYNPECMHSHSTPLHQAALAGHESAVRLLVERGARLDVRDKLWNGTPRGWAEHGKHPAIAEYLKNCEGPSRAEQV